MAPSQGGGPSAPSGDHDPSGVVIIEDAFDDGASQSAPDAAKWEPYEDWESANAPMLDSSRAHSAPNSARTGQMSGSGRGSFLVPLSGFPPEGNKFYVRVYVNWEKATADITGHGGTIVGAATRDNSGTEVRLGISTKSNASSGAMVELNVQSPADGGGGEVSRYSNGFTSGADPFDAPGYQYEANKWYCVEALFDGTPDASEFRLWVDGTEVEKMHVTDFSGRPGMDPARNNWAPSYKYIKIGAQDYDSNIGYVWYDDLVISTGRVGCD